MRYFEKLKSESEILRHLYDFINNNRNIIISREEVENLYFSLKTQRLVILNSKPGMGKTEMCKAFIDAFSELVSPENIESIFLSIEKDFDKSDLLGYVGLDEKYHPSDFSMRLFNIDSNGNPIKNDDFKLYFVILDEMNLSLIDFYFSKILAGIENNMPITLPNHINVNLPENCFFIGTINSYTYESSRNPLSTSVKRRANIINVKNPLDEVFKTESIQNQLATFKEFTNIIIKQSQQRFEKRSDVLNVFRHMNFHSFFTHLDDEFYEILFKLTKSLSHSEETKLTFGILQDMIEYLIFSNFDLAKSMDLQVVQKILPYLVGNIDVLREFELFIDEYSLSESKALFEQMKLMAQNNMGQIVPLC
jgi:MoxR-like ATPase